MKRTYESARGMSDESVQQVMAALARWDGEGGAGMSGLQESATDSVLSERLKTEAQRKTGSKAGQNSVEVERAQQAVDAQTSLVVSMLVGDPRAPGERLLLDRLHETEFAAKANQAFR